MTVPSETVSSAMHGAGYRNKGHSVLPVYCLDINHNLQLSTKSAD